MWKWERSVSIFGLASALALTPLYAAEDPPTDPVTAAAQAATAREKALNDLAAQRLTALHLNSNTTGTAEVKEHGGEFEGWLMSANAIDTAAVRIAGNLRTSSGGGRLVILAGDETFDLGLPRTMAMRLSGLERGANDALRAAGCGGGRSTPSHNSEFVGESPTALLPYVGALVNAFRTDTTITGFTGPTDARLIVNALAGQIATGDDWVIPSAIATISIDSPLVSKWDGVASLRSILSTCRAEKARGNAAAKAKLPGLDQAIAEINAFETAHVVGGGTSVSPLVQAIRLESLAATPDLSVVRVFVEKAGGSILVRRNLFTMLGAPAVGISGGAVVGWRVVEARTGRLRGGGNLSCRTELSNIRAIQAGRIRASSCDYRVGS